ncbi:MAG: protease inhibitor I42 family protein [Clostridia bacterium]|nr:protease inhibitor I42 family protein [Clostridia bacterium]
MLGGVFTVTIFNTFVRIISIFIALIQLLNIDLSANEVSVELYTNPSSGYKWEYSMDELGYLTLVSTDYNADSGSAITGKGGGTKTFTFRAIRSGTVNITFQYTKIEGFSKTVATEYVYTYDIAEDGTISLRSIQ